VGLGRRAGSPKPGQRARFPFYPACSFPLKANHALKGAPWTSPRTLYLHACCRPLLPMNHVVNAVRETPDQSLGTTLGREPPFHTASSPPFPPPQIFDRSILLDGLAALTIAPAFSTTGLFKCSTTPPHCAEPSYSFPFPPRSAMSSSFQLQNHGLKDFSGCRRVLPHFTLAAFFRPQFHLDRKRPLLSRLPLRRAVRPGQLPLLRVVIPLLNSQVLFEGYYYGLDVPCKTRSAAR